MSVCCNVWGGVAATLFAVSACSGEEGAADVRCVEASVRYAFPSPAWTQGSATLSPPSDDLTYAAMHTVRPLWAEQLVKVDGYPARPTLLIPLSGGA